MREYTILTDTGCDIPVELQKEWNLKNVDLHFHFTDDPTEYTVAEMDTKTFYNQMRGGRVAQTSAAGMDALRAAFEQELKEGRDVLYIAFSGGLSSTASTGTMMAKELEEEYPEGKVIVIDSLCASAGHGLAVYYAVKKRDEGATLEENAEYMRGICPKVVHWFTVDDLVYLKRGGRVSAATALAGTVLGIKPVLHVDDEGHLISMSKARGRKNSINDLAKKLKETATPVEGCTYFISHCDCIEDAKALEAILEPITGTKAAMISEITPVIGAHSGPGTLALFFLGSKR